MSSPSYQPRISRIETPWHSGAWASSENSWYADRSKSNSFGSLLGTKSRGLNEARPEFSVANASRVFQILEWNGSILMGCIYIKNIKRNVIWRLAYTIIIIPANGRAKQLYTTLCHKQNINFHLKNETIPLQHQRPIQSEYQPIHRIIANLKLIRANQWDANLQTNPLWTNKH